MFGFPLRAPLRAPPQGPPEFPYAFKLVLPGCVRLVPFVPRETIHAALALLHGCSEASFRKAGAQLDKLFPGRTAKL